MPFLKDGNKRGFIRMPKFGVTQKAGGFTLIELLAVVAIVGILASVVLASLNSGRAKSRDSGRLADIHQIQLALELFYSVNGAYPIVYDSAGNYAHTASSVIWACNSYQYSGVILLADCWNGAHATSLASKLAPFLPEASLPPQNGSAFPGCGGTGRNSVYVYASDGTDYKVYAYLESSPCLNAATGDGGTRAEAYEAFSTGGRAFSI